MRVNWVMVAILLACIAIDVLAYLAIRQAVATVVGFLFVVAS